VTLLRIAILSIALAHSSSSQADSQKQTFRYGLSEIDRLARTRMRLPRRSRFLARAGLRAACRPRQGPS